ILERTTKKKNRPIIYADEIYLHSTHTAPKGWTNNLSKSFSKPIRKGHRLIILHAGSKGGFIPNGLLIFKSGLKSGDYHDEMNSINFKRWLESQLIPNLPPKSVLVLDNTSYHNVEIEYMKKEHLLDEVSDSNLRFTVTDSSNEENFEDDEEEEDEFHGIKPLEVSDSN
ncbi:hypothetical protein NQ314_004295, partial [Rhamnusium bicolor]